MGERAGGLHSSTPVPSSSLFCTPQILSLPHLLPPPAPTTPPSILAPVQRPPAAQKGACPLPFLSRLSFHSLSHTAGGGGAMARSLAAAIPLKVSADALWATIKNPDIVPKIMPEYVAGCEYVEGDGSPGSIRHMKFGPVVAHFVTFAKERIETVDEGAKRLSYMVIDGELLNYFKSYQVSVEIVQGSLENECIVNWTLEYEPINPEIPSPEISKEGAIHTFNALESYLLGATTTTE